MNVPPELRQIMRRTAAVRDPNMHGPMLTDYLAQTPPDVVVDQLAWLLGHATQEQARRLHLSFGMRVLAREPLEYTVKAAIYKKARERGQDAVAFLFLEPEPRRRKDSFRGDPDPDIMDRTLGERKWMARKPNRDMLVRLLRVTEPDVVRILLDNPKVVEQDVVWIAARRPNTSFVLWEVARNLRWHASSQVRFALVQNPYSPPQIAVWWIPLLLSSELRQVGQDGALHPLIGEMVERITTLRAERREPAEVIALR